MYEGRPGRPLTDSEVRELEAHPHDWVALAARGVHSDAKDNMKDLIALKKVPLFTNLTLEQLSGIDRLMVTRRYLKGVHIFRHGDLSSELYVIVEGEVRIHRDHRSRMVTLATFGPIDVMGEMAPFTDQPRSASAQAVTPTTVRVLRKDRLEAILHEHPEVLLEVIRNLSHRLVVANEQLEGVQPSPPAPPAPMSPGPRSAPQRRPRAALNPRAAGAAPGPSR
ncbi:MAG: cyclic nucleotide-binding domain-containing protein [Candidatus Dormibacteraeota bacterium]|nr:cyclic nucleotide-binding domain-containing protein [Candidatus Dormibacteraeota bacterium]